MTPEELVFHKQAFLATLGGLHAALAADVTVTTMETRKGQLVRVGIPPEVLSDMKPLDVALLYEAIGAKQRADAAVLAYRYNTHGLLRDGLQTTDEHLRRIT